MGVYGGNVNYAINADSGYILSSIKVNDEFVNIENIETIYTLEDISQDINIIFTFEAI